MDEPKIEVRNEANGLRETYGAAAITWLASARTNGAKELTLGVTTLEPGESNPLHRHPNCEEALYVLAGEIEHHIEGTPNVRMREGDAILVPRDRVHQARNVGTIP